MFFENHPTHSLPKILVALKKLNAERGTWAFEKYSELLCQYIRNFSSIAQEEKDKSPSVVKEIITQSKSLVGYLVSKLEMNETYLNLIQPGADSKGIYSNILAISGMIELRVMSHDTFEKIFRWHGEIPEDKYRHFLEQAIDRYEKAISQQEMRELAKNYKWIQEDMNLFNNMVSEILLKHSQYFVKEAKIDPETNKVVYEVLKKKLDTIIESIQADYELKEVNILAESTEITSNQGSVYNISLLKNYTLAKTAEAIDDLDALRAKIASQSQGGSHIEPYSLRLEEESKIEAPKASEDLPNAHTSETLGQEASYNSNV